jgi:hypothetical protein
MNENRVGGTLVGNEKNYVDLLTVALVAPSLASFVNSRLIVDGFYSSYSYLCLFFLFYLYLFYISLFFPASFAYDVPRWGF